MLIVSDWPVLGLDQKRHLRQAAGWMLGAAGWHQMMNGHGAAGEGSRQAMELVACNLGEMTFLLLVPPESGGGSTGTILMHKVTCHVACRATFSHALCPNLVSGRTDMQPPRRDCPCWSWSGVC